MEHEHGCPFPVTAQKPYPPIAVEEANPRVCRLLEADFSSAFSEMTSVSQYLYHSWCLQACHPEVSQTLECISIVEMRHMDLLAQLILLLGGDPCYRAENRCARRVPWTAAMVSGGEDLRRMLLADILLEETAIEHYRRQCAVIRDHLVLAIIERIILDEEVHLDLFRHFLTQLDECTDKG